MSCSISLPWLCKTERIEYNPSWRVLFGLSAFIVFRLTPDDVNRSVLSVRSKLGLFIDELIHWASCDTVVIVEPLFCCLLFLFSREKKENEM